MTKPIYLGLGVAALGVAAFVLWPRPAPKPVPVAAAFPRCQLRAGTHAAYAIESVVTAQGVSDRLKTVLSWRVGEGGTIRAALSGTEHEQRLTRPEQRVTDSLAAPFMLRVDADCRFSEEGFAQAWKPGTRRLVSGLLHQFEYVVPHDGTALGWKADQSDGLGPYAAEYSARPLDGGAFELTKRKIVYRAPESWMRVQLVASSAKATLAGDWLESVDGTEHAKLFAQNELVADLEQHITLKRADDAFKEPDPALTAADVDWKPPSQAAEKLADAPPDPGLKTLALEDALARFQSLYAKAKDGDAYAAARFLADWLRARPEQAAVIADAVKRGKLAAALHPAVFLGLELCGTDEARGVLAKLLADDGLSEMNRARAASALSDVPKPTRESADALVAASRPDGAQLVSGTSVRALGHLASRTDALDPETANDLHDALKRDFDGATGTARTVDVLDAVGNSGDKSFAPSLKDKLGDPSNAVREHAARAMRSMPLADAEAPLLSQLQTETEPGVRTAIVTSLDALGAKDVPALTVGASQLATESDANVRAALIHWLGSAVTEPVAKNALVAQFHRETLPSNLQLIGRFLPASALK